MKFKKKQPIIVVEAITFDELIEYGKTAPGANIVNGMPWSFSYNGTPVTHETDTHYLIATQQCMLSMFSKDMLVTDAHGHVYTMPGDMFEKQYELMPGLSEPIMPAIEALVAEVAKVEFDAAKAAVVDGIELKIADQLRLTDTSDLWDWIKVGLDNNFCTKPFCETHDGVPLSDEEGAEMDDGGDPCINMVRINTEMQATPPFGKSAG